MPVRIANVLVGEDTIGDDEVINQAIFFIHCLLNPAGLILCLIKPDHIQFN